MKKNVLKVLIRLILFEKGVDKILKKVGEEASEVIIAAKNRDHEELKWEAADLLVSLTRPDYVNKNFHLKKS